jgi:hypothetical protein
MTIQEQLEWLIAHTTVLWVERHDTQKVVAGEKVEIDRFFIDQGDPISFSETLEPLWRAKFDSFGSEWNDERQKYRLLYDTMRAFFTSFNGLRFNKVASIEARDNIQEKLLQGDLAGSHLMQMYMSGKKALDLMTELQIPLPIGFVEQFKESRNKLFEHNHNPHARHLPDLILEPSLWEVIATKSQMTIYVHTANEREYEAFIDYYQDYYDLEKVFVEAVQSF